MDVVMNNEQAMPEPDIEVSAPASVDRPPPKYNPNQKNRTVIALLSILLIAAGFSIGVLFSRIKSVKTDVAHLEQTANDAAAAQVAKDAFLFKNNDNVMMQEIVMNDPICEDEKYRFFCVHMMMDFYELHAEHWNITGQQDIADRDHPLAKKIMRGEFTKHVDFNDGIHAGGMITAIIHHGNGVMKSQGDIIDEKNFEYDTIHDSFGDHRSTCKHIHAGKGKLCFVHSPVFINGANGTEIVGRNFAIHYDRRGYTNTKARRELFISCLAALIGAVVEAGTAAASAAAAAAETVLSAGSAVAEAAETAAGVGEGVLEGAAEGAGEAVGEGAGEAVGEGVGEAAGEGAEEAVGEEAEEGAEESEGESENNEKEKDSKTKSKMAKLASGILSVKAIKDVICKRVEKWVKKDTCKTIVGAIIAHATSKIKAKKDMDKLQKTIGDPLIEQLHKDDNEIDALKSTIEDVNAKFDEMYHRLVDEDNYSN